MRRILYGTVLIAVVFAIGCAGGSSSSKKKKPPPVQQSAAVMATRTINAVNDPAVLISFTQVEHSFSPATGKTTIAMALSNPPGWTIAFEWLGDVGGFHQTSSPGVAVALLDDFGDIYGADDASLNLGSISITVTTLPMAPDIGSTRNSPIGNSWASSWPATANRPTAHSIAIAASMLRMAAL